MASSSIHAPPINPKSRTICMPQYQTTAKMVLPSRPGSFRLLTEALSLRAFFLVIRVPLHVLCSNDGHYRAKACKQSYRWVQSLTRKRTVNVSRIMLRSHQESLDPVPRSTVFVRCPCKERILTARNQPNLEGVVGLGESWLPDLTMQEGLWGLPPHAGLDWDVFLTKTSETCAWWHG